MLIIGLGSQKRVGKDSLAAFIIEQRGNSGHSTDRRPNIVKMAFADALKEECTQALRENFPMAESFRGKEPLLIGMWGAFCRYYKIELTSPVEVTFDDPLCPLGKCRQALQWWGTEHRRAQNPEYWVDRMRERIQRSNADVVVITDMRFPNEYHMINNSYLWLKDSISLVWKLQRGYKRGEEPPYDPHPSEHALDGFHFDATFGGYNVKDTLEIGLNEFDRVISQPWQYARGRG